MQENDSNAAPPARPDVTVGAASPITLESAVELMRAEVNVRDDWRASLLRDVSSAPQPSLSARLPELERPGILNRPFSVRPLAALAACGLAMVAGSVGTLAVSRQRTAPDGNVASAQNANTVTQVSAPSGRTTIIRFALVAPGAKSVSIVGDFNGWDPNATPLVAGKDGTTWLVEMPLSAGRHVYAFMVDGDIVADPSAPRVGDHDFGVQNSVVLVGSS